MLRVYINSLLQMDTQLNIEATAHDILRVMSLLRGI